MLFGKYWTKEFQSKLASNDFRYFFQMKLITVLLGTASLAMGIMNIFTHKTVLMIATMSFAAVCYANLIILNIYKRTNHVSYAIFEISVVVLFTYFILTGGTAGFSPHWILILPACGLILLGEKRGLLLSGFMFLIVAFLLWIPVGQQFVSYDYSAEFMMRFPVVYLVFFALGFSFELIRAATYNTMLSAQNNLEVIAETDTLTKVPNRYWFNLIINRDYACRAVKHDGVMIIADIDDFKSINDIYGHAVGDLTLIQVSQAIRQQFRESDLFCRWGGEEFFAYLPRCDSEAVSEICERICKKVRQTEIEYEPDKILTVSVSVGAVVIPAGMYLEPEKMFMAADKQLYIAKEFGKDCYAIDYDPTA